MMTNPAITHASNDETVPSGQVPTNIDIGRQAKRARTALKIEECSDFPISAVGDRYSRLVEMSIEKMVNSPHGKSGIVAGFTAAITAACQPGGPIHTLVTNSITDACQPEGPIHTLVTNSINPIYDMLALRDVRSNARYINGKIASSEGLIEPLPDNNGSIPPNFPATLGEFWSMPNPTVDNLLQTYGLSQNGRTNVKKNRLALYCRLMRPVN